MKEPLRILHVIDHITPNSGVYNMIKNYYDHVDKEVIQFDFITHQKPDENEENQLRQLGSKIYCLPKLKISNTLMYIYKLNDFFKKNREYVIVHGHLPNAAIFYFGFAKLYKVPVRIIHSHSLKSAEVYYKKIRNDILNSSLPFVANVFFSCSISAAKSLYNKKVISNNNYLVINNGIDFNRFNYNQTKRKVIRKSMGLESKFVIGHVGRFSPAKNHKFIIDVFKEYSEIDSDAVLLIVGDGNLKNEIYNKVIEFGLEDKIIFTGIKSNIEELMLCMDIFIFPSLYEGLGMAIIEAQATGLNCIISENIPEEAIINNYLVDILSINNTKLWIERIKTIKYKLNICKRTSTYAKQYDISLLAKELENVYVSFILNIKKGE